ncbi:alpha/beta fold hydrolase [Denitrobaculum tricleocarpae]|uniref:Alpha/beta hydrolase n=1 Tax=Denitrobaculum tricleocarpae TaxID=2591009 RepID=A0A545TSZ8_9PROT|nr:alpha/beta hydrolase [Denitrobaculum tricleocarpae]TQV80344.1 alpha/beta hydrolase [Denitrobaculum tricleocarpae]
MTTRKTPVVFIPGIGCTGQMFRTQIEDLQEIMEPWEAPLYPVDTIEEMGRLILKNCPFDRFAVVGASMGGYLCFEIYKQAPDRVIALAPVCTMPQPDSVELAARRLIMNRQIINGRWRTMWGAIIRKCLAPSRRDDTAIATEVISHMTSTCPDAFLLHQRAMASREGYEAMLGDIRCPTTVIAGIDDEVITLRTQAAMQADIPGSHLIAVRDCGHLPTWEQPTKISQALSRWLGYTEALAA